MAIAFNAVTGFSFLFLFLLPILLFGPDYASSYRIVFLPIFICFVLVLVVVNRTLYFNAVMEAKIEAQDWKGLARWLLPRIIAPSGRLRMSPMSPVRVRLYVDACILIDDHGRILDLEKRLSEAGGTLLRSQALAFGLSRFVRNQVDEAADFFSAYLDDPKTENRAWLRFAFGFCRVLQGRFDDSFLYLKEAARSSDAVLAMLGGYLISTLHPLVASDGAYAELPAILSEVRKRVSAAFPGKKLDEECERACSELHVVFFGKILDDAKAWILDKSLNNVREPVDKVK